MTVVIWPACIHGVSQLTRTSPPHCGGQRGKSRLNRAVAGLLPAMLPAMLPMFSNLLPVLLPGDVPRVRVLLPGDEVQGRGRHTALLLQ